MSTNGGDEVREACSRLRDVLLRTQGMGRRDFLKALGAAASSSALITNVFGTSSALAQGSEPPVTFFVFGGAWKRAATTAFGTPLTEKTGIPVRYQEPYNFARVRAMHEAKAQQIDVFSINGTDTIRANAINMLMPIDFSIVDKTQLSPEQLLNPTIVGSYSLSMLFCYNKKKWPNGDHPKSWADFWNVEKFPGRRSLRRSQPYWLIPAALKADGVEEKDFYPLDIDRAFRSLDRIKPHVRVWWSDNAQAQQLMEQEEVDLIAAMNGRATESMNNGAPYEMVWNGAVSEGNRQGWTVPVGAPNPKGGMRFIDFAARAEPQAAFARLLYYSPLNTKAFEFLDPATAKLLPTYPENLRQSHILNPEWWADNYAQVQRRFERWLQS